jgi:hypothetical protein
VVVESPACLPLAEEAFQGGAAEGASVTVTVRAKLEYHSQKKEQGEVETHGELAANWLASHLQPTSSVWVGTPCMFRAYVATAMPFVCLCRVFHLSGYQ